MAFWLILFLGTLSIALGLAGLAVVALPDNARRVMVWLADMTPGQLRFAGLFICLVAMAVMLLAMLLIRLR